MIREKRFYQKEITGTSVPDIAYLSANSGGYGGGSQSRALPVTG